MQTRTLPGMRSALAVSLLLTACSGAPTLLSETGLYTDVAARELAPGVLEFEPQHALWSDGAAKRRWAWIPEGTSIDVSNADAWVFPVGTKLWKEFALDGVVLETRFLQKTAQGWRFAAYVWDADGREAREGAFFGAANVRGTRHDVPGQGDCTFCHRDAEAPLGFTAVQLASRPGETARVDLAALTTRGWLNAPLDDAALRPLSEDADAADALGMLHANCGGCHADTGAASDEALRLRLRTTDRVRADTGFFSTALQRSAGATIDGRRTYVVPGDAAASLVFHRLSSRGNGAQMPPLGTEVRDETMIETVRAFIDSLPAE